MAAKMVNKAKSIGHKLLLCNCSIDNQTMIEAKITPNRRPAVPANDPERENHKVPSGTKNRTTKVVIEVPSEAKRYGGPGAGLIFSGNGM